MGDSVIYYTSRSNDGKYQTTRECNWWCEKGITQNIKLYKTKAQADKFGKLSETVAIKLEVVDEQ